MGIDSGNVSGVSTISAGSSVNNVGDDIGDVPVPVPMSNAFGTKSSSYTFASQPRTVVANKKKYREPIQTVLNDTLNGDGINKEEPTLFTQMNIMFDPRIIRGSTIASNSLTKAEQQELERQRKQKEVAKKRKLQLKREEEEQNAGFISRRMKSPEAVEGRSHIQIQTEVYLEEITDRVAESHVTTQTDPLLDRPPSPLFIPQKHGEDKSTQIFEGDLFDFDVEVEGILQVIVGKTIEQSLLEVLKEEEIANLKAQQAAFEQQRNAELIEAQRLQSIEKRKKEEKERRIKQEKERKEAELKRQKLLHSQQFAVSFLSNLEEDVMNNLTTQGFLYDQTARGIEVAFIPALLSRVNQRLAKIDNSRRITDDIIANAVRIAAKKNNIENNKIAKKWADEDEIERIKVEKQKAEEEFQRKNIEAAEAERKSFLEAEKQAIEAARLKKIEQFEKKKKKKRKNRNNDDNIDKEGNDENDDDNDDDDAAADDGDDNDEKEGIDGENNKKKNDENDKEQLSNDQLNNQEQQQQNEGDDNGEDNGQDGA